MTREWTAQSYDSEYEPEGFLVVDADDNPVAENVPDAETARLIAAAPELRELLTRLHAAMQTGVITEGMEADTRALLARIDGEEAAR